MATDTDIARLQGQIDEYRKADTKHPELNHAIRVFCDKLQGALNDLIALQARRN